MRLGSFRLREARGVREVICSRCSVPVVHTRRVAGRGLCLCLCPPAVNGSVRRVIAENALNYSVPSTSTGCVAVTDGDSPPRVVRPSVPSWRRCAVTPLATRAERNVVDSAANDNKLLARRRRVHVRARVACVRAATVSYVVMSVSQSVPLPGCDVDAHSGRTLLSAGRSWA